MAKLTERGFKLKIKLMQDNKTQVWLARQLNITPQLITNVIYGNENLNLEIALDQYIEKGVIDDYYKDKKRPSRS
jgi:plasmid maintenance system antidote protein VapI